MARRLAALPAPGTRLRWLALCTCALLAGEAASRAGIPAAWLVAPMLVALAFAFAPGARIALPAGTQVAAQGVVGVLLGATFNLSSLRVLSGYWPAAVLTVGATLALSVGGGALLARLRGFDPATATLGTIPGGAAGMVAMSEDLSADARIVAFMQYIRVLLVVLSTSLLARFVLEAAPLHRAAAQGGPPAHGWADYLAAPLLAIAGVRIGRALRIPAGAMTMPLVLTLAVDATGLVHAAWPAPLPPLAYAAIGLQVGLLFDPEVLRRLRLLAIPILGFTVVLVLGCAALSYGLAAITGMGTLTAYLATAPGGMDSVTIAAIGSGADTSLVLAMQMARFLVVIAIGPPLVRHLARRYDDRSEEEPPATPSAA